MEVYGLISNSSLKVNKNLSKYKIELSELPSKPPTIDPSPSKFIIKMYYTNKTMGLEYHHKEIDLYIKCNPSLFSKEEIERSTQYLKTEFKEKKKTARRHKTESIDVILSQCEKWEETNDP